MLIPATTHMIETAETLIRAGHGRFIITRELVAIGASAYQANDAIRAARFAVPFSTRHLALR